MQLLLAGPTHTLTMLMNHPPPSPPPHHSNVNPTICHAVQLVQFFTIQFHPFWTTDFHCPHPVTFLHGVVGGWVETYRVDDKAALEYNVIWEQEKWHTQSHKMCFSMQCNDDMLWTQPAQLMQFLYKQGYLEEVVTIWITTRQSQMTFQWHTNQ